MPSRNQSKSFVVCGRAGYHRLPGRSAAAAQTAREVLGAAAVEPLQTNHRRRSSSIRLLPNLCRLAGW